MLCETVGSQYREERLSPLALVRLTTGMKLQSLQSIRVSINLDDGILRLRNQKVIAKFHYEPNHLRLYL